MKQLAYISTAKRIMSDDELLEILETSRRNNLEHNVTGVLLYNEGTFIQALEGEPAAVYKIFDAIERDARHRNVIKMIDKPLAERNFPDWAMGFVAVEGSKAKEVEGFLSSVKEIANSESNRTLVSILKTFIEANNLMVEK